MAHTAGRLNIRSDVYQPAPDGNDHPQAGGILVAMKRYTRNDNISSTSLLRAYSMRSASSLLLVTFLCFFTHADTDAGNIKHSSGSTVINISVTDEAYSLNAKQAKLSAVLNELGKTAGFKLKTFDAAGYQNQDWQFRSMSLPRLLDNLLRGYSTVMLYEDMQDKTTANDRPKLKELWLIAQQDHADFHQPSNIHIEIQLEQAETFDHEQQLTPEQRYEITFIDNLEGMTSDDVIDTLEQTLRSDKDPLIRKRAVTALSDIGGTRVLDALESGMGDRSADVRTELAKSFAGIKHQRSMLLLGQMLVGDHDAMVREQAVRSMYQQGTLAAHTFVEAALKDKNDTVKKTASEILQQWAFTPEDHPVE
jgi:hypothetical protein